MTQGEAVALLNAIRGIQREVRSVFRLVESALNDAPHDSALDPPGKAEYPESPAGVEDTIGAEETI